MEEYLYHYTSIESLLLILKNRTLAFNSLQNVDDLEETKSKDIENIGKICYVSCWTYDESESIPMWNMYTHNMQGVRIKLKKYPFKKYKYNKEEYFLKENGESFINYERLYKEDKASITMDNPLLYKVEYTDDLNKIYPNIKTITNELSVLPNGNFQTNMKKSFDFGNLGRYKRKNWDFQKEVRYIINMAPWSIRELQECKSLYDQEQLINRLEDTKIKAPYTRFFLDLSEEALNDIEILLGPKTTLVQEELINLIKDKYCKNAKICKSILKIR